MTNLFIYVSLHTNESEYVCMCKRETSFSWKADIYMHLQGKKLLCSKGNEQCFINDLLLHIASTSAVGVDGVLAISLEPDAKYRP